MQEHTCLGRQIWEMNPQNEPQNGRSGLLSGFIELPDGRNAEAERDAFFRKMLAVNPSPRDV